MGPHLVSCVRITTEASGGADVHSALVTGSGQGLPDAQKGYGDRTEWSVVLKAPASAVTGLLQLAGVGLAGGPALSSEGRLCPGVLWGAVWSNAALDPIAGWGVSTDRRSHVCMTKMTSAIMQKGRTGGRKLLVGNHREQSLSQGPEMGAFQRSWWVTGQSTKHQEGQFVAGSWSFREAHAVPGVAGAQQGGDERLTLPSCWN